MMFPVYDARVTIPGAPIIQSAPAFPYVSTPESGASHWLFGVDSTSLIPFGGSGVITPQSTTHVYGTNFVTAQAYNEALITNVPDLATQTFCRVVRYQPTALKNTLLLGNISAASSGFAIWLLADGKIQTLLRGNTPALIDHGVPTGVTAGDWIFVAYTERVVGGITQFSTYVGNAITYSGAFTAARPISNPIRNDAIGNAYQSASNYTPAPVSVAELIAFPGVYKTAQEIAAIYSRSKRRMTLRGIMLK